MIKIVKNLAYCHIYTAAVKCLISEIQFAHKFEHKWDPFTNWINLPCFNIAVKSAFSHFSSRCEGEYSVHFLLLLQRRNIKRLDARHLRWTLINRQVTNSHLVVSHSSKMEWKPALIWQLKIQLLVFESCVQIRLIFTAEQTG